MIIKRIKNGETATKLATEFNVGKSTITDIKKHEQKILNFTDKFESEDGPANRKTLKHAENVKLEEAIFTWFLQQRSKGEPISGPIVCEKAIMLNELLKGNPEFKATQGWLHRFKSRHGIRQLDLAGEKLSADVLAADNFKVMFRQDLKDMKLDLKNVYNADESGLNWKALPRKSLVSGREKAASGHKISKERVTVMVCANADGTHRLPMTVVGKSKKPRCFKNVLMKNLPVKYLSQKNAWMDVSNFKTWFQEVFVPCVKQRQREENSTGPVLLLLDNAPAHPSVDIFEEYENFKVMFLPPNVTSLIQPMDQGVIETLKRNYRKILLRRLLLGDEEGAISTVKKLNLKDCVYMIAESWDNVKPQTLEKGWKKLLSTNPSENVSEDPVPTDDVAEILEMTQNVPELQQCDSHDVSEWLQEDADDPGFHLLSDAEIVDSLCSVSASESDDDFDSEVLSNPSASEAFTALETAISWAERQEEINSFQLLNLKRIQNIAAQKRTTGLRQSKISEFFIKRTS